MKNKNLLFCGAMVVACVIVMAFELQGKTVSVKGYYRKNGTYVRPHVRNTGGGSYRSYTPNRKYNSGGGSSYRTYTPTETHDGNSGGLVSLPISANAIDANAGMSDDRVVFGACKAIYTNGRRCCCWVRDGQSYCAAHKDYDPENRPKMSEIKLSSMEKNHIKLTRARMEKIRKALDFYSDRRRGALPADLKTLQTINPSYLWPPSKDLWDRPYSFMLNREGLDVRSAGPDKKFGTKDDIVLIMER